MKTLTALGAALSIALACSAGAAHAQERAPGWIGISFDVQVTGSERRMETSVIITDVSRGSPADEAGIRAGDRLLRINDLNRASELRNIGERLRLRSGDRVRIVLEREGRRRDLRLRATARPEDIAPEPRLALTFEPDSMVETIVRAMDSLRVRLSVRQDGRTRRVSVEGLPDDQSAVFDPGDVRWAAPFEFFVFGGEQRDSLAREMEQVNEVMVRLREMEGERLRAIARTGDAIEDLEREDVQLRQVRATLEQLAGRSDQIRATMVDVARQNAGLRYVVNPLAVDGAAPVIEADPNPSPEFRPLTPYLLGRNRVAGAEVIDLRPELAEYFRVAGGVLVVDVPRGTPAGMAGILPGDVVTRIDRVVVRSVEDLRFGVSQAGDTLPISLVRRGQSLQVLLRR